MTLHSGPFDGRGDKAVRLPAVYARHSEDDRVVELGDEELAVLPDQTRDDTDAGWGERADVNDERLLQERPPHWD